MLVEPNGQYARRYRHHVPKVINLQGKVLRGAGWLSIGRASCLLLAGRAHVQGTRLASH